jgi:transposase
MEQQMARGLQKDPAPCTRVERMLTSPGVGPIIALTWALETGEATRFHNIKQAVSYCGLSSAEVSSGGKQQRMPVSKQRKHHLQRVLAEAAKRAPSYSAELAALQAREEQRGNRSRGTLAVARKLVALLLAVDRRQEGFRLDREIQQPAA